MGKCNDGTGKKSVYSIVEEIHDKVWYETQLELWEKEAKEGKEESNTGESTSSTRHSSDSLDLDDDDI